MDTHDSKIVVTLDAGGTNLVFGAMADGRFIVEPTALPSQAHDLDKCLATMVEGFTTVIKQLPQPPVAISFAFPGPADYPNGIIGGFLPNFPSFREGVALGPFLQRKFGVPVFINNDGDLFAYGEARGGCLPELNRKLREAGSSRKCRNLLGYTFGTGLGVGMVVDGHLNRGNNSCVETFCLPHKGRPELMAEEGASIRAIKRDYAALANDATPLEPKHIFEIAEGTRPGDQQAAREAFRRFGQVAGDAIATAVTLTDAVVVIGGGLTGARKYFMPTLLQEMRGKVGTIDGQLTTRVPMQVFNLDDANEFNQFAAGNRRRLKIYGTEEYVDYDPLKATGVLISRLGASAAISLGAYLFAIDSLNS